MVLKKHEPVVAPEQLAVDMERGHAEHAKLECRRDGCCVTGGQVSAAQLGREGKPIDAGCLSDGEQLALAARWPTLAEGPGVAHPHERLGHAELDGRLASERGGAPVDAFARWLDEGNVVEC